MDDCIASVSVDLSEAADVYSDWIDACEQANAWNVHTFNMQIHNTNKYIEQSPSLSQFRVVVILPKYGNNLWVFIFFVPTHNKTL